jgi:hypothetical protein
MKTTKLFLCHPDGFLKILTIELLKIAIALGIAIAGLLSGAREQLMKLDFYPAMLAIFTLGRAIETTKNLLLKKDS